MNTDKNTRIKKILSYFLGNRFSRETEEEVQRWIIEDDDLKDKKEASLDYWDSLQTESDNTALDALKRVNLKLNIEPERKNKISFYKSFTRIAAVLIPVLLIVGGYFLYISDQQKIIQIAVGYGETKQVCLPDGSDILVNAGSTIKYPKAFKGKERIVYLDGEAYFSVTKDESKPFIVKTNNLSVKVLGTEFNVKAYSNEPYVSAILNKGEIEVVTDKNESRILKPKDFMSYNPSTEEIIIRKASVDETINWMDGLLIFNNAPLNEILLTLERRFNVTIDASRINMNKISGYNVKFIRNDTLENILDIVVELVGDITYKKQGDNYILLEN